MGFMMLLGGVSINTEKLAYIKASSLSIVAVFDSGIQVPICNAKTVEEAQAKVEHYTWYINARLQEMIDADADPEAPRSLLGRGAPQSPMGSAVATPASNPMSMNDIRNLGFDKHIMKEFESIGIKSWDDLVNFGDNALDLMFPPHHSLAIRDIMSEHGLRFNNSPNRVYLKGV